jgi:CheY-like chemotaxis protein
VPTRPRVLLADDSPDLVKAVSRLLALDCEVVGTVADGRALLEAAHRLRPDAIVLDLSLPNVHGLEMCRQLTQRYPETRVIVFTASSDPDVKRRSLEAGAAGFVSKLEDDGDVLSTIQKLCVDRG